MTEGFDNRDSVYRNHVADLERQLAAAEHQQELIHDLLTKHAAAIDKPLTKANFPEVYCGAVAFEDETGAVLDLYAQRLAAEKQKVADLQSDSELLKAGYIPMSDFNIVSQTAYDATLRQLAAEKARADEATQRLDDEEQANRNSFHAWKARADTALNGAEEQMARADKAEAFKKWVHEFLDGIGVPHDPDPQSNASSGCRIGGRLRWLVQRADAAEAACGRMRSLLLQAVDLNWGTDGWMKLANTAIASPVGSWWVSPETVKRREALYFAKLEECMKLQADLATKDKRIAELEAWKDHALQVDLNRECQVLRERVAKLEAALKLFADAYSDPQLNSQYDADYHAGPVIPWHWLTAAARALAKGAKP